VDLARYPAEPSLSFPNAVVLTWKPSRSGTVTLRSHDSFLTEGLHTQIRASEGTACPPGQFFDADWISESLEFSVDADVTYHILLGTSDAIPEDEAGLVYLEITFE